MRPVPIIVAALAFAFAFALLPSGARAQTEVRTTTQCVGQICWTNGSVDGDRVGMTTTRIGDFEFTNGRVGDRSLRAMAST